MSGDYVRLRLIKISEDEDMSIHNLRRQWIGETYELGCLTHEKYLLLMSWIEADEAIEMIDRQIVESNQALLMDHSGGNPAAD